MHIPGTRFLPRPQSGAPARNTGGGKCGGSCGGKCGGAGGCKCGGAGGGCKCGGSCGGKCGGKGAAGTATSRSSGIPGWPTGASLAAGFSGVGPGTAAQTQGKGGKGGGGGGGGGTQTTVPLKRIYGCDRILRQESRGVGCFAYGGTYPNGLGCENIGCTKTCTPESQVVNGEKLCWCECRDKDPVTQVHKCWVLQGDEYCKPQRVRGGYKCINDDCPTGRCRSRSDFEKARGRPGMGPEHVCECNCPPWPYDPVPGYCYIRVMCGDLPPGLSIFAVHCWIETYDCDGHWNRYEVWQTPRHQAADRRFGGSNMSAEKFPKSRTPHGRIGQWPKGSKKSINYAESHKCGDKGDPCKCMEAEVANYPNKNNYRHTVRPWEKGDANSNTFAAGMFLTCIAASDEVVRPRDGKKTSVFKWGAHGALGATGGWGRPGFPLKRGQY